MLARAIASGLGRGGGRSPARIRQREYPDSTQAILRKQRSLGSERGLATPSPDGKGEITLGPSRKIMPLDPYSTLGRSCEPAYQVDLPARGLRGDLTRWLAAGPRLAATRLAARPPGREALRRAFIAVEEPGEVRRPIPDDDPWLSPGLPERAADVAQNPAVRARPRVHAARRCLMRIPGASRSVGRGRPSPDSGPAPATCLPGCAWRAISLPGSTLGAALRHRGRPPIPSIECCRIHPGRFLTGARLAKTAEDHSERCCGIPASSARTSVSR